MSITHFTVSMKYGCTQNVGDYSNVRPELEITLSGEGGAADAKAAVDQAFGEILLTVHRIVDDELEAHGQHVMYSKHRTYRLLAPTDFDFLALVPAHEQLPEHWGMTIPHGYQGLRYETIIEKLKKDPDYSARIDQLEMVSVAHLPCLEKFTFLKIHHPSLGKMLVLTSGNISTRYDARRCPGPLDIRWYDYVEKEQGTCVIMPRELFVKKMRDLGLKEGFTLYYCFDNDFSALPELPRAEPEEDSKDDIPFEDDDDDDDDDDDEDE